MLVKIFLTCVLLFFCGTIYARGFHNEYTSSEFAKIFWGVVIILSSIGALSTAFLWIWL